MVKKVEEKRVVTSHGNMVYMQDAIAFLKGMPDSKVDLHLFDPAYESLEKHRKKGTTTRLKESKASSNKWFDIFPNARLPELYTELYRTLGKNRHCYMMCDLETMLVTVPIAEAAGFKFWNALIWDKGRIGMGYHWRKQCEFVLFFEKGKRNLLNLGWSEVRPHKRVDNGYPTEKPTGLYEDIIMNSSLTGELVVDAFCGSGAGAIACIENGRYFWGNDINDDAIDRTEDRIADAEAYAMFSNRHMFKDGQFETEPRFTQCGIDMHDPKINPEKHNWKIATDIDSSTCAGCVKGRLEL